MIKTVDLAEGERTDEGSIIAWRQNIPLNTAGLSMQTGKVLSGYPEAPAKRMEIHKNGALQPNTIRGREEKMVLLCSRWKYDARTRSQKKGIAIVISCTGKNRQGRGG